MPNDSRVARAVHRDGQACRFAFNASCLEHVREADGKWYVTVKASTYAHGVFLQFPNHDGWFEDNYFNLLPGEVKQLQFVPQAGDVDFAAETLSVQSLWNVRQRAVGVQ